MCVQCTVKSETLVQLPGNPWEPLAEHANSDEPCLRARFQFQHMKRALRTKPDAVSQICFNLFPEQMNVSLF